MRGRWKTSVLIVIGWALVLSPRLAGAEPYAGLFVGVSLPQRNDVESKLFSDATFEDVRFETSVVFGGKAGYFFETPVAGGNFGLELEVSHFRADIESQVVDFSGGGQFLIDRMDVRVTPIVLSGLYRFPLVRSADLPQGRFQPYVGVGLGAFIANVEARTFGFDVNTSFGDTDVKPGFQALAGARVFLTRNIALFGEYKFVRTADFTFTLISEPGTRAGTPTIQVDKFEFHLTTHILQAGISYHW
jgi:opacity protein-like surface antigen